ncbi:MAG: cobalt-precorrin-6A reductase [Paracoccaceae bacterium]
MPRVLLLGGTTEAGLLARRFASDGVDAVYSYAGRTGSPTVQPLPTRVGGFGGVTGLAAYLEAEAVAYVVDATHPFAEGMSRNAIEACALTGTRLCSFVRPPWVRGPGDDWHPVPDLSAAVAALPDHPARVFLAIGRQNLRVFAAKPRHHYLLRLVDPFEGPLPLADAEAVIARGPFSETGDRELLQRHRIDLIVAKNSGGDGARAKLDAARTLGIPVILIERPTLPSRRVAESVDEVMEFINHRADLGV